VIRLGLPEPGETAILTCSANGIYFDKPDARCCHRLINRSAWEQQVSVTALESVRSMLEVPVTMTPRWAFGVDGTTYEVRFGAGKNAVQYKWWGRTPPGWEPLATLVRQLSKMARVSDVLQREWPDGENARVAGEST
jgi:hypothetical protein